MVDLGGEGRWERRWEERVRGEEEGKLQLGGNIWDKNKKITNGFHFSVG